MKMPPWGFPWHGLLISPGGDARLRVGDAGGAELPLDEEPFPAILASSLGIYAEGLFGAPAEEIRNVHLVRVPGIGALDLTPEEEVEQTAMGRAWRNYGLLVGSRMILHGRAMDGWLCIDPAGERWLVRPVGSPNMRYDYATIGAALTLRLEVVPFGYLGRAPAEPIEIQTTLANIQQDGEMLGGEPQVRMRPASIASHGRDVLIALYPKGASATVNDFPCGWLRLQLSGTGPEFGLSLTVLHSRTQAMGVLNSSDVDAQTLNWLQGELLNVVEDRTMTGTLDSISFFDPGSGINRWRIGNHTMTSNRTGRVCSVVFDDADDLVTVTADLLWSRSQTYNTPTLEAATGSLVAIFPEGDNAAMATGRIDYTVRRTATDTLTYQVVIKRDGAVVDQGQLQYVFSFTDDVESFYEPPISATLSPPEFAIGVEGAPPDVPWLSETHFEVNGGATYTFSESGTAGGPSWIAHNWGSVVGFDQPVSGTYTDAVYQLQRLSNQLAIASHSLRHDLGAVPNFSQVHRAIAAHAEWDNPASTSDPFAAAGNYNPVTYELVMSVDGTLSSTVMHI